MKALWIGMFVVLSTFGLSVSSAEAKSLKQTKYTQCVLQCNRTNLTSYQACSKLKQRAKRSTCLKKFFRTSTQCIPGCYKTFYKTKKTNKAMKVATKK